MAFVLQLFGGFRLFDRDGRPVPLPDRARALLAYLAVAPAPVPRQVLAELLSADGSEQEQRTTVRQTVYVTRKAMAESAVICTQDSNLTLSDALVSVDVRLFQRAIACCDDGSLAKAVDLYHGPFLEGERSPSSAFEEWLAARRAEFLEHAIEALLKLAGSGMVAGLHDRALAHARRALTLDPLREDAHRQVMRGLAAMGQRSNALRQYDIVRQTLSEELGIAPEGETEALREAIARGGEAAAVPPRRDITDASKAKDQAATMRPGAAPMRAASWLFPDSGGSRRVAPLPLALAMMSLVALAVGSLWLATKSWAPSPVVLVSTLPGPMVTPRLSIVVLPLANLSGDPDQEYFADGITDDLTTDLSRVDGSFVIARHTAFAYKGNDNVDVRAVGRELGIRYVLTGSVRRVGERVYIGAELIDAATAATLWTERFDGSVGELPALHNEVTGRVAATLRLKLVEVEGRRLERDRQPDPIAADDALRGWGSLYRPYSRENRTDARHLFERAIAKDPNTVDALVGLAQVLEGYTNSPLEDRQRADTLLRRALDLEPNRAGTHFVLGMLRRSQGRLPEAVAAFQRAIELDRNYARAYLYLGMTLMLLGHPDEAIPLARYAMRLNPRDPNIADHLWIMGSAQNLLGRAEEAIESLERANAANPRLWYIHLQLASAYGMTARIEEAERELAEALRLRPEFTSLRAIRTAIPQLNDPAYVALAERTFHVGLRRAGLPD